MQKIEILGPGCARCKQTHRVIQHVVEQCQKAKALERVIVATDDTQIWEVAQKFADVEMTRPDHPSGTDRIAEVASRHACDALVNIQGDEPLIDPAVIDTVWGWITDPARPIETG